jgi:hypothetical protein
MARPYSSRLATHSAGVTYTATKAAGRSRPVWDGCFSRMALALLCTGVYIHWYCVWHVAMRRCVCYHMRLCCKAVGACNTNKTFAFWVGHLGGSVQCSRNADNPLLIVSSFSAAINLPSKRIPAVVWASHPCWSSNLSAGQARLMDALTSTSALHIVLTCLINCNVMQEADTAVCNN